MINKQQKDHKETPAVYSKKICAMRKAKEQKQEASKEKEDRYIQTEIKQKKIKDEKKTKLIIREGHLKESLICVILNVGVTIPLRVKVGIFQIFNIIYVVVVYHVTIVVIGHGLLKKLCLW